MTDCFSATRTLFDLPNGVIYLDGNSLGPLPFLSRERLKTEVDHSWGQELISAWNSAGWMDLPLKVGNKIAALIGAAQGTVMVADSTSVNLFKVLTAALKMQPDRKVILSDSGNFPSDLYIAQGVMKLLDCGHILKVVAPEAIASALDDSVAVLMLTEVDYATGRKHDMAALTALAHQKGALTIWDLAHSAGAFPVDLRHAKADFAVGCGYKYLNGGPGAPAFVYVSEQHLPSLEPALSGWMGHAAPFDFSLTYQCSPSIEKMRAGTPSVLGLAALDAALDVWQGVDMNAVQARSIELSQCFIAEVEAKCPMLTLASPRQPRERGSQVSFRFEHGFAAIQALIARGVVGDFRSPNIMRFGFTPLYISLDDVKEAAKSVALVMSREEWKEPKFQHKGKVT